MYLLCRVARIKDWNGEKRSRDRRFLRFWDGKIEGCKEAVCKCRCASTGINTSVTGPSLSIRKITLDILDVTVVEENNLRLLLAFSTTVIHL